MIEAQATFGAQQLDVHLRVGDVQGKLYLDLADDDWRVVEIDKDGWRIIDDAPIRFRRTPGMQPLPAPVTGGSIDLLRPFLNVGSESDFILVVAWAVAVLRNCGPYPVIVLSGEQGSAKSTFSAILRALLDPNSAPLRALSREDRELFIAAMNGHVLAFDNVSGLPGWISDTLCRLATGGGFAVRQLYTDQDEMLFNAARPVILNGIEDIVSRPDLADRAIFLNLRAIPEECRKPEKEIWAAFERVRPQILGALLDAVSLGLRRLPAVRLQKLPRMADFAIWATACEPAFCDEGAFCRIYDGNRNEAVDNVIEADPVGSAVRTLMANQREWTGTATELLNTLSNEVGERASKAKNWPTSPNKLSGRLRRAATFLRKVGIELDFGRSGSGRERTREIRIFFKEDKAADLSSQPSADRSDRTERVPVTKLVGSKNSFVPSDKSPVDDRDDQFPPESAGWRTRI
ncbi:MAG: hypothetical protein AAGA21_03885 [Pseudomonadota bacterium]